MTNEVTVTMPLALTPEMLRAVKEHPTTKTEDRDEWHRRLGWLMCAWDVLVEHRLTPRGDESQREPPACTCPSGDGSLRWPCHVHPPA
jgi:hypothetical protein